MPQLLRWFVALAALTVTATATAQAVPFEFANFSSINADTPFIFTNNGGTSGTISASTTVMFDFTTPTGLSTNERVATLTITGPFSTFTPGFPAGGGIVDQPISSPITVSITENATGNNLLTALITGDIVGRGPNASLSGSSQTGQVVTYSSDFLSFTQPPGNSYNLGLGTIGSGLSLGPGGFLNTLQANLDGQFAANVSMKPPPAPEAPLPTLPAQAASSLYEFANIRSAKADQPLSFTNNGGTSGTVAASAPVIFHFTTPTGLSTADRAAHVTITGLGPSFTPAFPVGGGMVDQPISSPTTVSITEDATGKNLLTAAITGDILGRLGGPNASLSGSSQTGQVVTYSSDFLSFTQPPGNSYNLGLGTISPGLSLGPGGFLNTLIADMSGQFSGGAAAVPEPSTLVLLASGGIALAGRQFWRRGNALKRSR
jgi:hypothetical protein